MNYAIYKIVAKFLKSHAFPASSTQRAVREAIFPKTRAFFGKFTPKLSFGLNTRNPLT
jgi:hypothetical protein